MGNFKIIKFAATWCGPCKTFAPIFDRVSKLDEFKDIEFKSLDIEDDEGIDLVEEYQIKSVPSIVVLQDNKLIAKFHGSMLESNLVTAIKNVLQYNGE